MQLADYKVAGLAKKITPAISNVLTARPGGQRLLGLAEAYLGILQGKGAGTGWDMKGETVAAARLINAEYPTIVDVGASIGDWTALLARQINRPARYVLVEPSEVNWPRLEALRVRGEVHLVRSACGATNGSGTLTATSPGSPAGSLYERRNSFWEGEKINSAQAVAITTIEQIALDHGLDAIDYLKIDVEGAELDVLQGAEPLFAHSRVKALQFEFGAAQINSRGHFRDFWDLLTLHGFALGCITPGSRVIDIPSYSESFEHYRGVTNYLAVLRSPRRQGS